MVSTTSRTLRGQVSAETAGRFARPCLASLSMEPVWAPVYRALASREKPVPPMLKTVISTPSLSVLLRSEKPSLVVSVVIEGNGENVLARVKGWRTGYCKMPADSISWSGLMTFS